MPTHQASIRLTDESERVTHTSGALCSHFSPFNFLCPFEGAKLTCQRFRAGNVKYENDSPVCSDANWMKALKARDVTFFRDRAGHAMEHLVAEMRGEADHNPGGNLGAVGWWVEIMAYVSKADPHLYGAIQGKWPIETTAEQLCQILTQEELEHSL